MSKGKKKRKRKQSGMPPLPLWDHLIYMLILLVLIGVYAGIIMGTILLRREIAFSDETVMASEETAGVLWLLIPELTFVIITFCLWCQPYENRKPIFGRRNFKYGSPDWAEVYPLFMRKKPYVRGREKTIARRKQTALILSILLLISCIPFSWGLFGRDSLFSDGSIKEYNIFNISSDVVSADRVTKVEFETYLYRETYRHNLSRDSRWSVKVHLTTENNRYTFEQSDFRRDTDKAWLTAMLQLKACYAPEVITCTDMNHLDLVAYQNQLTAEEEAMLHRLFGISE